MDKSLVGKTSKPRVNEVEKGAIRRFVQAVGDTNPIYVSATQARRAGYAGIVAPPSFPATLEAGSDVLEAAGLRRDALLLAEQVYEYERPLLAGETVTVVHRIAEVGERDSAVSHVEYLIVEEEGTDQTGAPVYRGRRRYLFH